MRRPVALALLVAAFGLLVTANSAGYRYGISDQAFYIPAIDLARTPALFPRDRVLIGPQAELTLLDEALGSVTRATGIGLEWLFFAGYLLTVALFAAGVLLVGRRLYVSPWSTAALLLALTLRHRISRTGVNTFEGYFHPRVLAFSIGLIGIGAFWHGRRRLAALLGLAAVLVHPTTGGWFVLWIGTAWLVASPPSRRTLGLAGAAGTLVIAALLLSDVFGARLVAMDPAWMAAFADRDYLFPTEQWTAGTWLLNLLGPLLVAGGLAARARLGLATRAEAAVAAGALTLLAVFLLSLPLVARHIALAVQLQTSRVLWPLELLGTAYLIWALAEAPRPESATRRRQVVLVAVLALASAARGYYVLRIEHDNPLVAVRPAPSDWTRMGEWIAAHTPIDAHLLAEPRHVFPYGASLRVVARRDVLTEDVKDAAIALYGRDVAARVLDRRRSIGDFHALTERDLQRLDRRYELDYVIAERPLALPVVHRQGRLTLYSLRQH